MEINRSSEKRFKKRLFNEFSENLSENHNDNLVFIAESSTDENDNIADISNPNTTTDAPETSLQDFDDTSLTSSPHIDKLKLPERSEKAIRTSPKFGVDLKTQLQTLNKVTDQSRSTLDLLLKSLQDFVGLLGELNKLAIPIRSRNKWTKLFHDKLVKLFDNINMLTNSTFVSETKQTASFVIEKNNEMSVNQQIKKLNALNKKALDHYNLINRLQRTVETSGRFLSTKVGSLSKPRPSVKRLTALGDEYQRTLQVLVRQRGSQKSSGFELGGDVSGVGQLDDIVYKKNDGNICRFFQVKYSSNKNNPVKTKDLFKDKFPASQKSDLHLFLYLESFCKIKENKMFETAKIEEVTFVTNRELAFSSEEDKRFLIAKELQSDMCMSLKVGTAVKYGLNAGLLKGKYSNLLETLSKASLRKYVDNHDCIIDEFLEKTCIIVNYADLNDLKPLVIKEVLGEDLLCLKNKESLQNCVSQIENKLLKHAEFISDKQWKLDIDELKNNIKEIKASGFTDVKIKSILSEVYPIVSFKNISKMSEDIQNFLLDNESSILNWDVQNLKLSNIKVLQCIQQLKDKDNNLNEYNPIPCDIEDLVKVNSYIDYFESGVSNFLLICCTDTDNKNVSELISRMTKALQAQRNKVILISNNCKNPFVNGLNNTNQHTFIKKRYSSNFKYLNQTSQDQVLTQEITFQGVKVPLGSIFNKDIDFAKKVFDENCLWEVLDKNIPCALANTDAFESPGYDKKYYVTRNFSQMIVNYPDVKRVLTDELFVISVDHGMSNELVKNILVEKGINKKDIREWNPRIINKNGIVLSGSKGVSTDLIFDSLSTKRKNVHLLFMDKTFKLFFIDCTERNTAGNKLFDTENQQLIDEMEFHTCKNSSKIFILVGDSGVGKSTVLTNIANKMRDNEKSVWIANVNLRRFFHKKTLNSLGDLTTIQDALNLVDNMVFGCHSASWLERNLLKEGLKPSNKHNFKFVLLLDGYNEITRSLQGKVNELIHTLITNKCNIHQIWVTTQVQDKAKLERAWKVPAYILKPFTKEEQKRLMVSYWIAEYDKQTPPRKYDESSLLEDAENALTKWTESISDEEEKSFTEVSLNLRMLADVLLERRKIDRRVNLLKLYNDFVQHRFHVYRREIHLKNTVEASRSIEQISTEGDKTIKDKLFEGHMQAIHQELSVKLVIAEEGNLKKPQEMTAHEAFLSYVGPDDATKTLSKIGLVTTRKGVLDFSHYSFAQYFFSEYIINNLNNSKVQIILVTNVLKENSFHLCRRFLNRSLMVVFKSEKEKQDQTINKRNSTLINVKLKSKAVTNLQKKIGGLTTPIKEGLKYLTRFLIEKSDDKVFTSYIDQVVKEDLRFYHIDEKTIDRFIALLYQSETEGVFRQDLANILINSKIIGRRCISNDKAQRRVQEIVTMLEEES